MPTPDSKLQMAAAHLNASIGPVVSATDIASALRAGSLAPLAPQPRVEAMVSYLFIELEPRLIALCAREAGAMLERANDLYRDTLRNDAPRAPAWEATMEAYV